MLLNRWKSDQEVPEFYGIFTASGEAYKLNDTGFVRYTDVSEPCSFLDVVVLAKRDLYGGKYRVKCGEAMQHGSIGVIVLEDLSSGEAIWSLVSENSNPFDQIEVKAGYVLILSSSGTLFRFCEELQNFTLSVP